MCANHVRKKTSPQVVKSIGNLCITINNNNINFVSKVKSLGLIIDSEMNWIDHVNMKTRNCNSILWALYPIQTSLSFYNRKLLVNAYVLPILNYMSIIWGSANISVKLSIEKIIRRAGRFVLNLRKFDPVKFDISQELEWLFPDLMYKFEVLKLTFSIIRGFCPPYFKNYLEFNSHVTKHTRQLSYVSSASVIQPKSTYGKRSFKYNATLFWLRLDENLKSITNKNLFRLKLKQQFIKMQIDESIHHSSSNCNLSCIEDVVNYCSDTDDE